jgi:ribosomal protein S18 acetylase RimI-like enzyme
MAEYDKVTYPGIEIQVEVEQLDRSLLDEEIAYSALKVVVPALRQQFEGPEVQANLPAGTIEQHFQPEDRIGVQRYLSRMETYMDRSGTSYWFARTHSRNQRSDPELTAMPRNTAPSGLIKISPSRGTAKQKARISPPNLFINDILVIPDQQGQGMGTKLLYTAASFGGYRPDKQVVLNAYAANPIPNAWFRRLGLRERPDVEVAPVTFNGHDLQQVRFGSGELAIRQLVVTMEIRHPELQQARGRLMDIEGGPAKR